jgi:hypothetical protein
MRRILHRTGRISTKIVLVTKISLDNTRNVWAAVGNPDHPRVPLIQKLAASRYE